MKYYNHYFLISLCFFFCSSCLLHGQPVIVWDKVYGSYYDDNGMQIIATKEGGCVFTAWPFEAGSGDVPGKKGGRDVWACKLDANGELVYSRILGGSNDDYAASVIRTDDGGAIFQYGTLSSDFDIPFLIGKNDEVFHKLDVDGKTDWVRMFGCTEGDSGLAMQKEDGNFLMYLYYGNNDGDLGDIEEDGPGQVVIEFDQETNVIWKTPIDFQMGDERFGSRIYATTDGGFVFGVSSEVNVNNQGETDICVWKYSANRTLQWKSCFGGEDDEIVDQVLELPDGEFLVGGVTWSKQGNVTNPYGKIDIWMLKLDQAGKLLWQRTLGGNDLDGFNKMVLTDEGKSAILLCSTASDDGDVSFNHWGFDIWLVKIDLATNDIIWEKTYGSSTGSELAVDMVQLEDGSLIVLGEIIGHGQDGDVTGETQNGLHTDIWVFKLAPDGVKESEECGGFTISPNPVNGNLVEIALENLITVNSDVRVFDVRGALVGHYPDLLLPNVWRAEIELPQDLPSGVYLVQVDGCSDSPQVKKLVKVH